MDRISHRFLYLFAVLCLAFASPASARIDPPDHVYYGQATLYGSPILAGSVVEARTNPGDVLLRRFVIGSDTRLGGWYKLAIPLDTVDPRTPGRARVGDPIRFFIDGQLAGEVSVGVDPNGSMRGIGSTTRLDLDPQKMGSGPAISIHDTSVVEGHAGTTIAVVQVTLNAPAEQEVGIQWETRDDTATGGDQCGPGVDFIQRSGETLVIPVEAEEGAIEIQVCGDTDIEADEQFKVVLLSTTDNYGVFTTDSTAVVTIVDDDNVPSLQVPNIRVNRPTSGTATARFVATLSRAHEHDVSFHWQTQNGTGIAGLDYLATSGTASIAAGELTANLDVQVLPATVVTSERTVRVVFSEPVSLALPQTEAVASLVDPRFDQSVQQDGSVTGADVPDLSQPTALALSPDGLHAYATSGSRATVLRFDRDASSGALSNPISYKSSTTGFANAKLQGLQDLKPSADGRFLYAVAMDDNAITVLARDPADGSLSFVESLVHGGSITGMKKPFRLALSPDSAQVYVLGRESNAVVTFDRDATSGQLTFARSVEKSAGNLQKLESPSGIAVSPGGAQVLVTARMGNALLVFDRERDTTSPQFGALAWRATQSDAPGGIAVGLGGAFGIALSPDGSQVYVTAENDNAVSWFNRSLDGSLSLAGVIRHGEPSVYGLEGTQGLALTPDGTALFAGGHDDDSLSVFERDGAGGLAIRQTVFKNDQGLQHLAQPGAVVASADSRFIYVAASGGDSAIVVYRRLNMDDSQVVFSDSFEETIAVP